MKAASARGLFAGLLPRERVDRIVAGYVGRGLAHDAQEFHDRFGLVCRRLELALGSDVPSHPTALFPIAGRAAIRDKVQ